jgi:hypothetical protein
MNKAVEIENIEEMRRLVGIDDVELRQAVRGLRAGDLVKITLLTAAAPAARETVLVRLTGAQGPEFRGRLAEGPTAPGLSGLRAGARVVFRAAHIHSVAKGRLTHAR